jgi:hypothetical protein
VKSALEEAGVDIDRLDRRMAANRTDWRRVFRSEDAELARHLDSDRRAFDQALHDRRSAFEALTAGIPRPGVITLDKPFLIWDNMSNTLVGSQIEPMNSFANVSVDTNTGGGTNVLTFYFFWENDTDQNVVLDVTSALILNGRCAVGAGKGILSGDAAFIDLFAIMNLLQWWRQPPTSPLPEQTQDQQILFFQVEGGGVFGDPDSKSQVFSFTPFEFSYTNFLVPPKSPIVIEVTVFFSYNFSSGGRDINDFIIMDFADPTLGRRVICPSVELEIQQVNR